MISACGLLGAVARAELSIVRPTDPPIVFSGRAEAVSIVVRNSGAGRVEAPVEFLVHQLSSATAVPLGEAQAWTTLTIAGGQTVIEKLELTLPEVRAATLFRIAFTTRSVPLGHATILALPSGLLAALAAEHPFVLLDPQQRLQPALAQLGVKSSALGEAAPPAGSVVIAGPFSGPGEMPAGLSARLNELARGGCAVVALLPARDFTKAGGTLPLTGIIPTAIGKVVVASGAEIGDLAVSAQAQFALHRLVMLALDPSRFPWPESPQP